MSGPAVIRCAALLPALLLARALAAEPAPAPPSRPSSATVGLGLVALTGNARSFTGTLSASGEYRADPWTLAGKASGAYGEARSEETGATQVTAEGASLFVRADRRVSPRISLYLLAGAEADHPKSVELRLSQEVGVGRVWVDDAPEGGVRLLVRTDLGFRLSEEFRHQYFPVPAPVYPREFTGRAPRASALLRAEPRKDVFLSQEVEVLSNLGEARWSMNATSKLGVKAFGPVALGVSYAARYDSAPPAPKVPWDTLLTVTLEYVL